MSALTALSLLNTAAATPIAASAGITWVEPIETNLRLLAEADFKAAEIAEAEVLRQETTLGLIASESFQDPAVLAAQATPLGNKYGEGFVAARYYKGCNVVDRMEQLAIARAREVFRASHVFVQLLSGSPANLCIYKAFLRRAHLDPANPSNNRPADLMMGMKLGEGGHLTHGYHLSITGSDFRSIQYGVRPETGLIDMDEVSRLAREHHPNLMIMGATAYARDFDYETWRAIADEVGAILMADISHTAGLIAAGHLRNPLAPGGAHLAMTTTHKSLLGPRGAMIMLAEDFPDPQGRTVGKGGKERVKTASEVLASTIIPGMFGGPHFNTIAGIAVALGRAKTQEFRALMAEVIDNARALAAGLMAEGFKVVTGGTDNHLILVDLRQNLPEMTGKQAANLLEADGIVANANMVPGDDRNPWHTSGLRFGTVMLTQRGVTPEEMGEVAKAIARTLKNPEDETARAETAAFVVELTSRHPVYRRTG